MSLWFFQWRKSVNKLRQKIVILVIISLSVSMVSGLGYYFDSVSEVKFKKSFTTLSDFEITHYQIYTVYGTVIPRLGYSENFAPDNTKIQDLLRNSKMEFESISKYGLLTCEQGFFANNNYTDMDVDSGHSILGFQKAHNASEIKFALFDDSFYQSQRFSEFFKIIDGRAPTNSNEILIDYGFALKNSFEIGENVNITSRLGTLMPPFSPDEPPINSLTDFYVKNTTVVGIYLPIKLHYTLDHETFDYSYIYENYLENMTYEENPESIDGPALFSWYNFTGSDFQHPFQKFYQDIYFGEDFYNRSTRNYVGQAFTRSGYLIAYQRENIKFKDLNQEKQFFESQISNITHYLPRDESLSDFLSNSITQFYNHFQTFRILIQILNLPLILFALMISTNLNSINKEEKISEIYLLRGRGLKKKSIRFQLLLEIFISST
ncbi:MAG: hypothetical protein ACTSVU_09265, partial [Promethearchaeota archaeon]